MTKKILVAGGAGFIGSHVVKMLDRQGYCPIVFDNLSKGNRQAVTCGTFIEGDLADVLSLKKVFDKFSIEAVMHFAALIDVGESVREPGKYYANNVCNTLNLLEAMRQHGVKTFIFSSTAAIFGNPQQERIAEDHPCAPINPYGYTKLFVEQILRDYDKAYGLRSTALRYFNAAGGDPDGKIKNYNRRPSNLIPVILQHLRQIKKDPITINGTDYPTPDGTCVRDYIHIDDLGRAHISAMEKLFGGAPSNNFNLGNGKGFSVWEVIRAAEKVTGLKVRTVEGPRRAGDPPILIAESTKAREYLGWTPHYPDLETMILHAWKACSE